MIFSKKIRHFIIPALSCVGLVACQTTPSPQTLYDKLGGDVGVTAIVSGTLDYTLKDDRIAHTFENSNVPRVEKLIVEQICELADGPCTYSGQTMERSHRGLALTSLHFNALVENMQKAMTDNDIDYRTQNQLLALLAPMHRDVVTE